MTDYQSLGIRPLINAYATVTKFGGSLMPPEVVSAMTAAAAGFVDLADLQRRVGERIAQLTHNEAAYVTSGAAAGIQLAAAAAVMYKHPEALKRFPDIAAFKDEAIIFRGQRNPYDYSIQAVGLKYVEIAGSRSDLEAAISERTACIFWFHGALVSDDDLPLAELIAIAKARDIPVIVDAAAQLPPVENLWRFTEMGAALALFSGGKDLRGPQSTGLMLGRRDLIDSIRPISNPNHGLGRPFKVGKEEMMGILAAVERYLQLDHDARAQYCEDAVTLFCEALNPLPGVCAEREFPNEAGQPLPWCRVTIDPCILGKSADEIVQAFLAHEPGIAVSPLNERQFHLNPMTLNPGEELIVRDACLKLLT
ncbi:MAG: aminotransferase class V-fold PLP-dependent enzyme [Chloroflexi bacterium]|nr:aminotransferase class V-fold PLP-dependent enzyme [Chloroflexota bacterium]